MRPDSLGMAFVYAGIGALCGVLLTLVAVDSLIESASTPPACLDTVFIADEMSQCPHPDAVMSVQGKKGQRDLIVTCVCPHNSEDTGVNF